MQAPSFADPSERVLEPLAYLAGALGLAGSLALLWLGVWRLRAALLPAWRGAPARLAEAVVCLGAIVVAGQALGTVGWFTQGALLGSLAALGACALLLAPRLERPHEEPIEPPRAGSVAAWIAAISVAVLVAAWAIPTAMSLAGGMNRADTLWYHMPLSLRFVETGSTWEIFHFDPIFFAAYYPAVSELFHAVGILAFDRDLLSPLINLGFVALALLGAHCVGRPWGLGPHAERHAGADHGVQMLVEFQGGEALNDIVGVAFIMAAAGLLATAYGPAPGAGSRAGPQAARRPAGSLLAVAMAGLAAGLALGTKLSFVAPFAALTIAVVWIAGRGARWAALGAWTAAAAIGGAYWYVRNIWAVGNPVPVAGELGPLGLPAPERAFELRPGHSVAHYWSDTEVWVDWFAPGLAESFGVAWPLTLVALVAGAAWALARAGAPLVRGIGFVVLLTTVAYLFTPLTAGGEQGEPIAFEWNLRYLAPAVALGLAALPLLEPLRATAARRSATLVGLTALFGLTVASLVQWQHGHLRAAAAAFVLVVAGFAAYRLAQRRFLVAPPTALASAAVALALLAGALGAGYLEQRHYLDRRYYELSPRLNIAEAARWARDLRGATVATTGVRGVFNQYAFSGTALENHVQWLGVEGENGAWLRIPDCETFRRELNEGGYTHVVTMYDPFDPGELTDTKEALWVREDPAAEELIDDGPVSVFELAGPLDPAACGDLPELEAAELDGRSVNAMPMANQP